MQDPKVAIALNVMMGINLMGDDDKIEIEPTPLTKLKKDSECVGSLFDIGSAEKAADEGLTEEQKQVFTIYILSNVKFV